MTSLNFSDSFDRDDATLKTDPFAEEPRAPSPELVSLGETEEDFGSIPQLVDQADPTGFFGQEKTKPSETSVSPNGRPKRPLSGYNLFFKMERERIINGEDDQEMTTEEVESFKIDTTPVFKKTKRRHRKTHGKIGFRDLARRIALKWKNLDPDCKAIFENRASGERARYVRELEVWKKKVAKEKKRDQLKNKGKIASSIISPGLSSSAVGFVDNRFLGTGQAQVSTNQQLFCVDTASSQYQLPQMSQQGDYFDVANQAYNLAQASVPNAFSGLNRNDGYYLKQSTQTLTDSFQSSGVARTLQDGVPHYGAGYGAQHQGQMLSRPSPQYYPSQQDHHRQFQPEQTQFNQKVPLPEQTSLQTFLQRQQNLQWLLQNSSHRAGGRSNVNSFIPLDDSLAERTMNAIDSHNGTTSSSFGYQYDQIDEAGAMNGMFNPF